VEYIKGYKTPFCRSGHIIYNKIFGHATRAVCKHKISGDTLIEQSLTLIKQSTIVHHSKVNGVVTLKAITKMHFVNSGIEELFIRAEKFLLLLLFIIYHYCETSKKKTIHRIELQLRLNKLKY